MPSLPTKALERVSRNTFSFFTQFGTHFIKSLTLGTRSGRELIMQKSAATKEFHSGVMLEAAASVNFLFGGGEVHASVEKSKALSNMRGNQIMRAYDFAVGGNAAATNNIAADLWSEQSAPVAYILRKLQYLPGLTRDEQRQVKELSDLFFYRVLNITSA